MTGAASVTVRKAALDDTEAIAVVHAAAWQTAFTFLPARFLEAMTAAQVLAKWRDDLRRPATPLFVAVHDDRSVVGFLQVRATGGEGEVMSLYVHPSSWRRGVGSTLLAFAEAWLIDRRVHTATLWTAKESHQARGFYEHHGWRASGATQTQHLGPSRVALHEVEYRKTLSA